MNIRKTTPLIITRLAKKTVEVGSVRAVSTGTYIMGAINATAMYDGNYNSTFGNGRVMVR